jgi:hypothetical protein
MTGSEKRSFKKRLHQHAVELIRQRITDVKRSMDNAQASANQEEKSSAGDKYETSRAMSQLEKDMHAKQLAANNNELAALLSIDCNTLSHSVETGTVVVCKDFSFFIAAGLGKIYIDGKAVYFLSPAAPVAKLLFNKVAGDGFIFNKEKTTMIDIF